MLRALTAACRILLLAFLITGCSSPEIQPLEFGPAPWQAGEQSVYSVDDVHGNPAGTAEFVISRGTDGGWLIQRVITAQGITEEVFVDVEEAGYRPRTSDLTRTDDSGRERVQTTYDGGQADLKLTSKQDVTTYQVIDIPSDARDQRTLPMLVRCLPLQQDYATRLNSFLPIVPLLERVTVTLVKQEPVEVPAGKFNTWLVELANGDIKTRAWIDVQAPHALVKFFDGRNRSTFQLTGFQAGQ